MQTDDDALELRLAIGRLSRRIRLLYSEDQDGEASAFLELAVLSHLKRHGTMAPSELAASEGVTAQAVAPVLTSLETRGLVTRSVDIADGRRRSIVVTEAGIELLESRDQRIARAMFDALERLTESERAVLAAAIPLLDHIATQI
jgi:DNA-binding MarR family transcriptional regulator